MRRITFLAAAFIVLLATTGWSEDKEPKAASTATITVKIDGLTCTTTLGSGTFPVQAWSFGATQSVASGSGGGGGAGKATVSDLSVQRKFDECSPALFGAVTTGKHFATLTLTQQDKKGPVMIVTLTDILISAYQLTGSQSNVDPVESVSFNFAKICINDIDNGAKACFDFKTQTAS
jgi:type VI protein secretion system component Hcp